MSLRCLGQDRVNSANTHLNWLKVGSRSQDSVKTQLRFQLTQPSIFLSPGSLWVLSYNKYLLVQIQRVNVLGFYRLQPNLNQPCPLAHPYHPHM